MRTLLILFALICLPQITWAEDRFAHRLSEILRMNGWEIEESNSHETTLSFRYFSPNGFTGRGFVGDFGLVYLRVGFHQTDDLESLPWADSAVEQIHHNRTSSKNMFGVRTGSKAAYVHGLDSYTLYYRYGNRYFSFQDPIRYNYDPFIDILRAYCIALQSENIATFEKDISLSFLQDKDFFEATRLLQEFLIQQQLYSGKIDGEFGYGTAAGFQMFLKQQGHYRGEIDRKYGRGTRKAIKDLQKDLQLQETGILNLETARKIIEFSTSRSNS